MNMLLENVIKAQQTSDLLRQDLIAANKSFSNSNGSAVGIAIMDLQTMQAEIDSKMMELAGLVKNEKPNL